MTGLNENTCKEIVEAKYGVKIILEKPCVGMFFNEDEKLQTFYHKLC